MGFKTNEIIELICKRPGIRLVEIADIADLDLDMVLPSIQAQIDRGDILKDPITAPNGRPTWSFRISESSPFANTLTDEPKPAAYIAPAPMPRQEIPAGPARRITFVDRAVAYLEAHPERKATSSDLHRFLELQPHQVPSAYLKGGIDTGRLVKDGKYWHLGDDKPQAQAALEPPVSEIVSIVSKEEALAAPPEDLVMIGGINVQDYLTETPVEKPADNRFACAQWSDGMLQLSRGSKVIVSLTPEENRELRKYLQYFVPVPA
jgi:hypothetical protein